MRREELSGVCNPAAAHVLLMHLATGGGGRGRGEGEEGVKLVMRSRYTRPATATTTFVSKTHMAHRALPGIVREGRWREGNLLKQKEKI